jgi:hypothetical protein
MEIDGIGSAKSTFRILRTGDLGGIPRAMVYRRMSKGRCIDEDCSTRAL